jgi:hypothetical protein
MGNIQSAPEKQRPRIWDGDILDEGLYMIFPIRFGVDVPMFEQRYAFQSRVGDNGSDAFSIPALVFCIAELHHRSQRGLYDSNSVLKNNDNMCFSSSTWSKMAVGHYFIIPQFGLC